MRVVGHAILGPAGHGVTEVASTTATGPVARALTSAELDLALLQAAEVVHVHYTDKLFGSTCELAAETFRELVERLARPVTVTLHDLPMGDASDPLVRRRSAAYASVVSVSSGVVTSSRHEAGLLALTGAADRPAAVIPLPIERLPDPIDRPVPTPEVGVLGWIYPGKGHDAVAAALPPGLGLAALGAVSPGHDDLLVELTEMLGDRLRCSGFLPDDELLAELHRVAIPVAAHRGVSASASIGGWLAAGRRPLVVDGPWARELLERCPGAIAIFQPGELMNLLADPPDTWLNQTPVGPGVLEVSQRLQAFCDSV